MVEEGMTASASIAGPAAAAGLPGEAAGRIARAADEATLVAIVEPALSPAAATLVAECLGDEGLEPYHATGKPGSEAAFPALIAPCTPALLESLLALGASEPWGVLAICAGGAEIVTTQWNSLSEVRSPSGEPWSAALHDPRVLADLSTALDAATRARLMGPLTLLAADDRTEGGAWAVLEQRSTAPLAADAAPLVLTPALVDAASLGRLRRTRARLARHLQSDGFTVSMQNGHLHAAHASGPAFTLSFHPDGRLHELADALGPAATFAWPAPGQMRITRADGSTFVEERDTEGAIVRHGWEGETIRRHYDARGRMTILEHPTGERVLHEYDATGALQWRTGTDGVRSGWERDPETDRLSIVARGGLRTSVLPEPDLDVVCRLVHPDGSREELQVCGDARRTLVLRDGSRIESEDTGEERVITWPDGSQVTLLEDADGRILAAEDASGRIERQLDAFGRPTEERIGDWRATAAWSALGKTSLVTPAVKTSYRRTADGRLSAVVIDGVPSIGVRWQPEQATRSLLLPGDRELRTRYRPDGRPRSEQLIDRTGRVLAGIEFRYDIRGRVTSRRTSDGALTDYFYDAAGRLERIAESRSPATDTRFVYDVHGNLLVTGQHRLGRGTLHEPTSIDDVPTLLDPLGRLHRVTLAGAEYALAWRGDDRLVSVVGPDSEHRLSYDALGRLRRCEGAQGVEEFDWFGGELVGWCGIDGAYRAFVSLPGELAPRVILSSGRVLLTLHDARGAIAGLIPLDEGSDSASWELTAPFGRDTQAQEHPFGLAGQLHLNGMPFVVNGGRAYLPAIANYLSGDPAALPISSARYAYAFNDPLNQADPSGLFAWPVLVVLGVVAAYSVGTSTKLGKDILEVLQERVVKPIDASFATDGTAIPEPSPTTVSDSNVFERLMFRGKCESRGGEGCCPGCTD